MILNPSKSGVLESNDVKYERLKEVCTQCGKSYSEGTKFCPGDGMELMRTMMDPLIGTVLPRRYRVLSLLGRGSMSVVYRGVYEPLQQPVAVKMLKSHLVSDPQQAKRFQQEIKTAGALNHRNIVGILDFGVTEQGVPYLVMDYLEGASLSDILDNEERISVNRTIRIFSQACDALAYAHNAGVIHRDLKPSNLVLLNTEEEGEVVKIVDFGIAKIMGYRPSAGPGVASNAGLTATGEVVGTPLYMSPEQANGRDLDGRSDIYSLGCVLYHAITGRPPFVGDTAIDTIRMQITSAAPPIEKVRPDLYIPERMNSVIIKALQKDPRLRYQNMEHLKADLESCASRRDTSAVQQALRVSREMEAASFETVGDDRGSRTSTPMLALAVVGLMIVSYSAWNLAWKSWKHLTTPVAARTAAGTTAANTASAGTTAATTPGAPDNQTIPPAVQPGIQPTLKPVKVQSPAEQGIRTLQAEADAKIQQGYYRQGDAILIQALEKAKTDVGERSPVVADIIFDLALVREKEGKLDSAEQLLNDSLAIRHKSLGVEHPSIADSLYELGRLEFKVRRGAAAETMFKNALEIRNKVFGEQSAESAEVYAGLAEFYDSQNKLKEAEECYRKALSNRQASWGVNDRRVLPSMQALSKFLKEHKKQTEAKVLDEQLKLLQSH
jgi:serine/threonine protein kinase